MKHTYRFIGTKKSGGEWEISKDEYLHLSKVLRLKQDDEVEICDGKGTVCVAKIKNPTKSRCDFDPISEDYYEPSRKSFEIYIGALKPSSLEGLISPLVELGVGSITFFGQPGSEKSRLSDKVQIRCEKLVVSAIKQSKNPYMPALHFVKSLKDVVSDVDNSHNIALIPGADISMSDALSNSANSKLRVYVGGEKGWHESEIKLLNDVNVVSVSLGKSILRAWTAAVAAAALCNQLL